MSLNYINDNLMSKDNVNVRQRCLDDLTTLLKNKGYCKYKNKYTKGSDFHIKILTPTPDGTVSGQGILNRKVLSQPNFDITLLESFYFALESINLLKDYENNAEIMPEEYTIEESKHNIILYICGRYQEDKNSDETFGYLVENFNGYGCNNFIYSCITETFIDKSLDSAKFFWARHGYKIYEESSITGLQEFIQFIKKMAVELKLNNNDEFEKCRKYKCKKALNLHREVIDIYFNTLKKLGVFEKNWHGNNKKKSPQYFTFDCFNNLVDKSLKSYKFYQDQQQLFTNKLFIKIKPHLIYVLNKEGFSSWEDTQADIDDPDDSQIISYIIEQYENKHEEKLDPDQIKNSIYSKYKSEKTNISFYEEKSEISEEEKNDEINDMYVSNMYDFYNYLSLNDYDCGRLKSLMNEWEFDFQLLIDDFNDVQDLKNEIPTYNELKQLYNHLRENDLLNSTTVSYHK